MSQMAFAVQDVDFELTCLLNLPHRPGENFIKLHGCSMLFSPLGDFSETINHI